jgi:hypothetical protein
MALRLRRGTDAERGLITPLQGELIYATDTKKIYVGDGAAVGGILVGPFAATDFDLVNDTTPQLGGDLDLNGNNITGIGNINIDGTITATGNIGLGDADADEITVGGVINSSLRPALDTTYDLGTAARRWQHVYAGGATIDQTLTAQSIAVTNNITGSDSSVLYNALTDTLSATNVVGNFTGSLFSDGSTLLVDGISGTFYGSLISTEVSSDVGTMGVLTIDGSQASVPTDSRIIINATADYLNSSSVFNVNYCGDTEEGQEIAFTRGRGTLSSPTPSLPGDEIVLITWAGRDTDSATAFSGAIRVSVDPDATVSSGAVPGYLSMATANSSGVPTVGLGISSSQQLYLADNTVAANSGSGTADVTGGVLTYLKINVGGTEYAMPLYGIVA